MQKTLLIAVKTNSDGRKDGRMGRETDGRTDGWTGGWTDRWTDGRTANGETETRNDQHSGYNVACIRLKMEFNPEKISKVHRLTCIWVKQRKNDL